MDERKWKQQFLEERYEWDDDFTRRSPQIRTEEQSLPKDVCEQYDQKKSPNVYKKLPKSDFTRKMKDFTPLQKLPNNVGDLYKLTVA